MRKPIQNYNAYVLSFALLSNNIFNINDIRMISVHKYKSKRKFEGIEKEFSGVSHHHDDHSKSEKLIYHSVRL